MRQTNNRLSTCGVGGYPIGGTPPHPHFVPEFSLLRPNKAPYSPLPLGLSRPYCHQSQPSLYLGAAGRHHDNHTEGKNWWSKGPTVNQQLALEALRNVVIDSGNKVVSASLWHEEHRQKCPDLARQRAGEARHALIEARIVGSDKHTAWVINENK